MAVSGIQCCPFIHISPAQQSPSPDMQLKRPHTGTSRGLCDRVLSPALRARSLCGKTPPKQVHGFFLSCSQIDGLTVSLGRVSSGPAWRRACCLSSSSLFY